MSSELAKQLRLIQQQDQVIGGPTQSTKFRASFLFDPKEAADYDADSIYALAMDGLGELQQLDPVFLRFQPILFSSQSLDLDRSTLTASENAQLDVQIQSFLRYLSPYFLHKPAHKVLEWLIRKFRINEMNVPALIEFMLPYHETVHFVRMIQILYFQEDDRWGFLFDIKKNAKMINRSYLAQRCLADRSILSFIFESVQWFCEKGNDMKKKNAHIVPFFTYLCLEYITLVKKFELVHFTHLMPFVMSSVRMKKCPDLQMSGYMLFLQIMEKFNVPSEILGEVLLISSKFCADTISKECVLFISRVMQINPTSALPKGLFENLVQIPTIQPAIEKASSTFDIVNFCDAMLNDVKSWEPNKANRPIIFFLESKFRKTEQ